jgi:phage terminase large subunit-like protein
LLEQQRVYESRRKIYTLFPDTGPFRRELYAKHLEHFRAGAKYRERLFMAANRVGKSVAGGYETTLHLTGDYPDWWEGRRFDEPTSIWAAGDTSETVRDIIQAELLGPFEDIGTGLIPGDSIVDYSRRGNVPDAIQSVRVKHISGGISRLGLKSYDQKRKSFQGTGRDVIWLDEEPDISIWSECLLRTMTTNGIMILTFTPLLGISEVVQLFLEDGKIAGS